MASASPLNRDVDSALRLQESGASAIVLPSLFEEEVVREELEITQVLEQGTEGFAESLTYFPEVEAFESTADRYLATIAAMKAEIEVPVIASLNATSSGGWVRFARLIEEAGADALELNLYRIAADPARAGAAIGGERPRGGPAGESVDRHPARRRALPYYSALANFALGVIEAGANGLVLFNRFYRPDLDADSRKVVPSLELSQPWGAAPAAALDQRSVRTPREPRRWPPRAASITAAMRPRPCSSARTSR